MNDLIKKSTEVSLGPPAVRHLLTTQSNLDETGKTRKWTFGQKHAKMQNKTILMVGETGTGKTTLINTMVNYYLGVKYEDKVWFEITEEEKRDQTESKTSEITVYEIFSDQKPFSLTIIDTPGYGDTGGIEKDMEIPQNLYKLFLHYTGVKDLDAVCLVLKASQNRITEVQHYIFDAILSLFGKDIKDNIVLFITHSFGLRPTNVLEAVEKEKVPCCQDAENKPMHFLFNNCQSEICTDKKTERAVKSAWETGEESLDDFFKFQESQQKKSVSMTLNVLKERMQLEACVQSLKERIEFTEAKQKELNGVQTALKLNKEDIEKDGNFLFTVNTAYKEKVDITGASWWDQKATCCDKECKENCHEFGCWLAFTAKQCEVMNNNRCTVCGCHYSKHLKEAKKYVTKWKEEKVTFEELKKKYRSTNVEDIKYDKSAFENVEARHEEKLEKENEMMKLESNLKNLLSENEQKKKRLVKEAYETIIKLSEIALKPDSAFTVQHLDFLIPRVRKDGEAEWAQKLEKLQEAATKESTTSTVGYLGMKFKNLLSGK